MPRFNVGDQVKVSEEANGPDDVDLLGAMGVITAVGPLTTSSRGQPNLAEWEGQWYRVQFEGKIGDIEVMESWLVEP